MRSPKRLLPTLSLLALAAAASAEVLERVVAKVNGDIVTLSEFQARQVAAVQAAGLTSEDRVERYLRENNARILQEAVDDLLLVQKANEEGMRLRPEYIKEIVDGIKKENNIATDEELQDQLRREGMSLDELKRNIERSILRRQLLSRELESKIAVSEAEVRAYYDAHKAEFDRPGSLHLQEIVVKTQSGSVALATDLVRRARGGEDFEGLARNYSSAPTRGAGGDLGKISRGDLTPDIEKAAFALPVGGVSDPLPTEDGYRILKVVEKTESSELPFDGVKADIQKKLASERTASVYEDYLAGLRKEAIIDIRVREVPLQATVPTGRPLDIPGEAGPGAGADAEISTSPQAAPQHVVPEPAAPRPQPSPTPIPD